METEFVVTDYREANVGSVTGVGRAWLEGRSSEQLNDVAEGIRTSFYNTKNPPKLCKGISGQTMYINPLLCLHNDRQRYVITAYMEYLISEDPTLKRWVIDGVAGTGKSSIINILDTLAKIEKGKPAASIITAPTGAAAGNVGGSTMDRAFKFSRGAKEYVSMSEVRDLRVFKHTQDKHRDSILLMVDECYMCGRRIWGHMCQRCDEIMNDGRYTHEDKPTAGRIPCIIMFGDPKQLPPVCDKSVLDNTMTHVAVDNMGLLFWQQFTEYWILTEPVRQNSTGPLIDALNQLRCGYTNIENAEQKLNRDSSFWNARTKERIGSEELSQFSMLDDSTIFATCYNKDRDTYNAEYINKFDDVHVVRARYSGKSGCVGNVNGSRSIGMAGAISLVSYLAVGMMVKLTVNVIPELCLANQSRGVIRDIIYPNGYDRNEVPILVLEMKGYKGKHFVPIENDQTNTAEDIDRSKYVVVPPMELRCDCKGCTRFGLLVRVAKADSIHSLQGMTIGYEKAIKHMVLKWSSKAESMWPNIVYVAGSRVQKESEILLAHPIAEVELKKVATTKTWKLQDSALQHMNTQADIQLEKRRRKYETSGSDVTWGSKTHFIETLKRYISRARVRLEPAGDLKDITERARCEILACLDEWVNHLNDQQ